MTQIVSNFPFEFACRFEFSSLKIQTISVEELISRTLENIIDVKSQVKQEITALKDKLTLARETIGRFKSELAKVQGTTPIVGNTTPQATH